MVARKTNVIEFPHQKLPPRGGADVSFEAYGKVVRVEIRGDVHDAAFHDWIVATASAQGLVGWVRERTGQGRMDGMFAGTHDAVADLINMLREGNRPAAAPRGGACPIAATEVTERPLRGDEPLWSGFHRLPPV